VIDVTNCAHVDVWLGAFKFTLCHFKLLNLNGSWSVSTKFYKPDY
jgi:hypothetical protein